MFCYRMRKEERLKTFVNTIPPKKKKNVTITTNILCMSNSHTRISLAFLDTRSLNQCEERDRERDRE